MLFNGQLHNIKAFTYKGILLVFRSNIVATISLSIKKHIFGPSKDLHPIVSRVTIYPIA